MNQLNKLYETVGEKLFEKHSDNLLPIGRNWEDLDVDIQQLILVVHLVSRGCRAGSSTVLSEGPAMTKGQKKDRAKD